TLDVLPHECRAVTLVEHVGLANVLIDAARLRRQMRERVRIPAMDVVVLRERKRTTADLDDPHRDPWIGELLAFVFGRWSAPPFPHMWCRTPVRDHREVCFDDW